MKSLFGSIRWKARQKYSQIRCYLGGGYYVWQVEEGTKFVSRRGDAFSHVLYVCQGHEKFEINWCRSWIETGEANQSIIDCGANIGYFSALLAQTCSLHQILAIEGNKRTANLCRQNFDILGIKNIKLIEAVLSSSSSDNYVIPDMPGQEPWQQAVKADSSNTAYTVTLDEIIAKYKIIPSLVKIDCEGFETFILRGASHLLNCLRPALMIECNDYALKSAGTSRRELFDLLKSFNYKLFHLASFTDIYPFGISCDEYFPALEFNFAAIPNNDSHIARWQKSVKLTQL
jgi:FkbM family methyltransferase